MISLMSFWCLCCHLWTCFLPFSGASVVDFVCVNACWEADDSYFFSKCEKQFYLWNIVLLVSDMGSHFFKENANLEKGNCKLSWNTEEMTIIKFCHKHYRMLLCWVFKWAFFIRFQCSRRLSTSFVSSITRI